MLEVPRVNETSEYAQNNQAEFGLRRGGAEFGTLLGQGGLGETGQREVTVAPGVSNDPDLMLPGGGIDIISYDSYGHQQRIGRFMGRRVDVAI